MISNAQFRSSPPPPLSSPQYARDYNEVVAVGAVGSQARPSDRADAARFYATLFAVGTWNLTAQQLATAEPKSLSQHARVLALLNMSLSDGLAASMETKYHYRFWRPETALGDGDLDGNERTTENDAYVPFISTPCFPGYPSAHASSGYAGRSVLERVWGRGGHSITLTHPALADLEFHYTNLKEITDDIDDARVYGGIHFRFDQEAGAVQGRRVGQYVFEHSLLPVMP